MRAALLVAVALAALSCSTKCEQGAICGSHNSVAPTTIITSVVTGATPTPSPTPGCVPQTAPFTCVSASPVFEAILAEAQRSVPAAPEPIYVAALVEALNKSAAVCAIQGPASDEVTIKARNSNAHSETWDVVRADGAVQAISPPKNVCSPSRF